MRTQECICCVIINKQNMQNMKTMYINNNLAVSSIVVEESRRMKAKEASLGLATRMSLALLLF